VRPWVVSCSFLPARGMALFPFILVKKETDKGNLILINHEKIHLAQQLELLILPFYLLYFFNYFINLVKFKKHHLAYLNICFEREAYFYESDLTYLKGRKICSWKRFL